jgi:hypothetical protein
MLQRQCSKLMKNQIDLAIDWAAKAARPLGSELLSPASDHAQELLWAIAGDLQLLVAF